MKVFNCNDCKYQVKNADGLFDCENDFSKPRHFNTNTKLKQYKDVCHGFELKKPDCIIQWIKKLKDM